MQPYAFHNHDKNYNCGIQFAPKNNLCGSHFIQLELHQGVFRDLCTVVVLKYELTHTVVSNLNM